MQIRFLQMAMIVAVFLLVSESGFSQGKLTSPEEGEFEGSYAEDQVMTFFNPDNDYDDAFLESDAKRITAYVVQNARDVEKTIKQLSVRVMSSSSRFPGEGAQEYRRRLQPFLQALNSELNKKNRDVSATRWNISFIAAGGAAVLAGVAAFLWLAKEKKPILQKRLKRAMCFGLVGCICGGGLGMLGSQFYGTKYSAVEKEQIFAAPPDNQESDKR